jgi:hypothetical protein
MKTIVINLYGGPGCGKSTIAALAFGKLKQKGINCELVTEYAKDKVWEESYTTLKNQIYVFGKQLHRMWRLNNKVNVIITDSPLPLSIIYDSEKDVNFENLVMSEFNKFDNFNIIINRSTKYQIEGRYQTEEEAKKIDSDILSLLCKYNITTVILSLDIAVDRICEIVLNNLNNE